MTNSYGFVTREELEILSSEANEVDLAQIAQLVEQRTENPRVAGSIPALGILL